MAIAFDTPSPQRSKRGDDDYAIESFLRGLRVLEALEGSRFEPISTKRVAARTRFSYDFCFRALKTLKVAGYVRETPKGWQITARLTQFSTRLHSHIEPESDS